jgi:hypothetical protein
MMKLRNKAIGAAMLATASAGVILLTSHEGVAQPGKPVTPVSLVSPLPVPVTGSVGVSGGAVAVSNPLTSPIPVHIVNEAVQEPFQTGADPMVFTGSFAAVHMVTAPAGKRLVIEHVSALIDPDGSAGLGFAGIVGVANSLDLTACQSTSPGIFSCSSQTKYFVEPGQVLRFAVQLTGSGGGVSTFGGTVSAFVSGHYIPAP